MAATAAAQAAPIEASSPVADAPLVQLTSYGRPRRPRPLGRLTAAERAEMVAIEAELDELGVDRRRPRTRAECPPASETCPWISCRHHLWLDVTDAGNIRLRFPRENIEDHKGELCSLRIADDPDGLVERCRLPGERLLGTSADISETGVPRPQIGRLMNLSRGSVKLIEEAAIVHLKEGLDRLASGRPLDEPPQPVVRSARKLRSKNVAPVESVTPTPDDVDAVRRLIAQFGRSRAGDLLSVSGATAAKLAAGERVFPRTLRVVRERLSASRSREGAK